MRIPKLLPVGVLVVGVAVAACSGGAKTPTVPNAAGTATTASQKAGSSMGQTPLAEAVAYSQCMRTHGVSNFPDPVATPSGGYGYRTTGIDPNSPAFHGAIQACKALPSPWNSTGKQLSPAVQQQWLNWATCIRAHGVPDFGDPTFSGGEVHLTGGGSGSSPQVQTAMDACKPQMPSTGGLGG